ncbi:MAG: proliferating cell nuclear antigen (pcna) [Thaumarchaeota archaeon]|nr:proliferating cell nuclear antigen (pcna) [Nitrososphaerota archaeon]
MTTEVKEGAKFRVKSANAKDWKAVVSAIESLVEEATFTIEQEGVMFRAMDPSHVGLIDLHWGPKSFESFQCDKADKFTLHVEDFRKIIDRAGNDSFEICRTDKEELSIREGSNREFQLHLLSYTGSESPLPKLNFDSKFTLDSDQFKSIMQDISTLSAHMKISTQENKIIIQGKADEGSAKVELEQKDKFDKASSAVYSLEYLQKLCKPFSGEIKFSLSTKMPLKMSLMDGTVDVYLAPRSME